MMKRIIKMRWLIFLVWIAVLTLSVIFTPDLNKTLRAKGSQELSSNSPSMKANNILQKMDKTPGNTNLIVFNSKNKLSQDDMENIKGGVNNIKSDEKVLGINNLLDPFNMPDIKSRLISKDEKTVMMTFKLDKKGREVIDIKKEIQKKLTNVKISYYITGSDFINDDYMRTINTGVDKSAILTILFILIVLIIMFRSVVTPLISLVEVGISYIVSFSIVGFLVKAFNYPISALTQIVLVLILFGIGTDYNILLFNRFKEELSKASSIDEAIIKTYRTAGKTIVFSIITVFIAFLSLTFAKFGIYQSANCVAIAVIVLLTEILTFTPFIMKTLGKKMFWPSKKITKHKENKYWGKVTSFAVNKPIVVSLIIILVLVPQIYFNYQKSSYDTINELSNSIDSVKGFDTVSDKFGKGQALPTTVVLENDNPMDNNNSLATIDNLTKKIKNIKGVKNVSSVTEPLSDPIQSLYISNQTKTVVDGLFKAKNGIDTINNGMEQINSKLKSTDMSGLSRVNQLTDGTTQVENGMNLICNGMQQVNNGIAQGANGAGQIADGAAKAQTGLNTVIAYTTQLSNGLDQLQNGYSKLGNAYDDGICSGVSQVKSGINALNSSINDPNAGLKQSISSLSEASNKLNTLSNDNLNDLIKKDPNLQKALNEDPTLQKVIGGIQQYSNGLSKNISSFNDKVPQITDGISNLNTGINNLNYGVATYKSNYDILTSKLSEASNSLKQINEGQKQISSGLSQLNTGASTLAAGLNKAKDGQGQLVNNMPKLISGLDQVKQGQITLNNALSELAKSMPALKDALSKSSDGLTQVSNGLSETNGYLNQLNSNDTFFAPNEVLNNPSFKQSLNMYMTDDRKTTKLIVVLDSDPYSSEAMQTTKEINDAIPASIKDTSLENAKYGVAGISAQDYDLNNIASSDLNTMRIVVLVSVFVILLLVIRSPFIALYISLALMAAYYISSTAINFIVFNIFKYDGLSWNVPFFSFVMIVALGVDYSIFLMMRFKEYKGIPQNKAIMLASENIGGVVMSAALILGGTFITMIPAGVKLLTELALAVAVGLLALSILLLPIFLPSLIALPNAIKWYYDKKDNQDEDDISA